MNAQVDPRTESPRRLGFACAALGVISLLIVSVGAEAAPNVATIYERNPTIRTIPKKAASSRAKTSAAGAASGAKATKPTTNPSPAAAPSTTTAVPTTAVPTTTVLLPPPARIGAFDRAGNNIFIRLEAPVALDGLTLVAHVQVVAIGVEEGTTAFYVPMKDALAGVSKSFSPDPDSKYTIRISWKTLEGTQGASDERVIESTFPQPFYRGPVSIAGPGWTALLTSDFIPARRNPCAPLRVHYDPRNAPLDFTSTLETALRQVSEASGVEATLMSAGPTPPDTNMLVINWVTGPTNYLGVTRQSFKTDARGVVWLVRPTISLAARRSVVDGRWQTVILHELGHVMGLQHSHNPTSLMFSPVESGETWPFLTTEFNQGDKDGLFAVGAKARGGGCAPTVLPEHLWPGR